MVSGDCLTPSDAPIEMIPDEVRQDLSVRLGSESMVLALEFEAQGGIILDDAVMDEGQSAGAIQVRVRVKVAGQTVGGPPCMAQAQGSASRPAREQARQLTYPPNALAHVQPAAFERAEPGGIVAPIFQAPQSLYQERRGGFFANIANNPAHKFRLERPLQSRSPALLQEAQRRSRIYYGIASVKCDPCPQ